MKKSTIIAFLTAAILTIGSFLTGSSQVVISQVYGGGGNSGATYQNDFVELFNRGGSSVSLSGWSVQYASATGSSWSVTALTATTLAPGQYYLIKLASSGAIGALLPTADATNTGVNLSGTTGKVALVNTTTALSGTCPTGATIQDFIGFGTTPNCNEGGTNAPAPSNTTADIRASAGCTDNNVNSTDFATGAPNPRNTATTLAPCAVPLISVSTNTLSGFGYLLGAGPSAEQTFTVSGSSLTANISIAAATDFEISLSSGAGYTTPITLTQSGGLVSTTTIYVRMKSALAVGSYSGTGESVVLTSAGATAQNVACSGTVSPLTPNIVVGTLTGFGNQAVSTTSAEKTYSLTGTNLTAPIIVTPPVGFEISKTTGTGFVTNPSTLTFTPSSGAVSATIYVRFSPLLVTGYTDNITHTSTGATAQNVAVTGTGVAGTPTLPVFETFNYADNSLLTANGWVAHSGAGSNAIDVGASNGLTYTGYSGLTGVEGAVEGNAARVDNTGEDDSKIFTSVTTGTIYFSFLTNVAVGTTGYYIHLGGSTSAFAARIFVKPSATAGKINFGLSNTSTASYAATPTDFDPGTTYLIVVKYDVNATGAASLWVKATGVPYTEASAGTPEATTTGSGQALIDRICLRQYDATQSMAVDGIRIGQSWASILAQPGTPIITAGTLTSFGHQDINTTSAEKSYVVSGLYLSGPISIVPPAGFEISQGTGGTFVATNPITLTPSSGTVANTTIYVRFAPTLLQDYVSTISHASSGAETVYVPVSGTSLTVNPEPTNHVTAFAAGTITTSSIALTWTDATGAQLPNTYLIKASSSSAGAIQDPIDGIPEANSALVQNVAQGTGTVTFSGLSSGTVYFFKIYPYTNTGISVNYKTNGTVPQVSASTLVAPALVLYEDFNYAPPAYIGGNTAVPSSSNNWVTHSGAGGTIDIQNGNLSYTGLQAPTGYMVRLPGTNLTVSRDINRALPTNNTSSVMYYSAVINVADTVQLNATTPDYFMHFGATAGSTNATFGGRLGIKKVGATTYRLSICNTSTGTVTFTEFAQDLNCGTPYFVVVKYDRVAAPTVASLWVNPASFGSTEPAGSVSNSSGTGTFGAFASICLRNGSYTPKADIDEIRVGTSWADVTPAGITSKTLNLTGVKLEGLYAGNLNPMNPAYDENGIHWPAGVADHINVELHNASTYSTIEYTATNVELSVAGSATVTVPGTYANSYFVTVKHRNSLETTSATAVSFSGSTISQSFATPADVFGGNLRSFFDGGYSLYGGDVSQDGLVDGSDMAPVDNQAAAFSAGYLPEDCNGDGLIDGSDLAIVDNNAGAFVGVAIP